MDRFIVQRVTLYVGLMYEEIRMKSFVSALGKVLINARPREAEALPFSGSGSRVNYYEGGWKWGWIL